MTTNELSDSAEKLSVLANINIEKLAGKCKNAHEVQDYYLGLLRKQCILLSDLSLILKNRNPEFISTPFIILRSLIDDFLHLLFLECQANKEIEITRINADSYKHSFNSLKDLTFSNYKHFDGQYPHYLTNEQFEKLKLDFKIKEKNKKYFKNIDTFKFIVFKTVSDMTNSFTISRDVDIYRDRAYYLWKEFSSFVHYSNYSFEYEMQNAEENLLMIEESLQYCYNSIYLSFKYFERSFDVMFQDDQVLNRKYQKIHEC